MLYQEPSCEHSEHPQRIIFFLCSQRVLYVRSAIISNSKPTKRHFLYPGHLCSPCLFYRHFSRGLSVQNTSILEFNCQHYIRFKHEISSFVFCTVFLNTYEHSIDHICSFCVLFPPTSWQVSLNTPKETDCLSSFSTTRLRLRNRFLFYFKLFQTKRTSIY